ncbi:microsomal signal peptidase 12 kDa subunit-domain-containing protein [Melampsora americana]|nr:microsomal signal peptidase 12 kDa subunit-domain-containing protein [Melampsora americana]
MDSLSKKIDEYVDKIKAQFEGKIDLEGQRLAEKWNQIIILSSAIIAFLVGYFSQSMMLTFGIYGVGVFISLLVVVPPWPCYNKNPIKWLPKQTSSTGKSKS